MIVIIYAVLMIASFVITGGVLAIILNALGADSDEAPKVAFLVLIAIHLIYYFYLVVEENPLGLAFQSS